MLIRRMLCGGWTLWVGGPLAAFLVAFVSVLAVAQGSLRTSLVDLMSIVPPLLVAALCVVGAWRARDGKTRWFWALVAAGFLTASLGETTWAYYELVLDIKAPYPSWADASWLTFYPLVFVGLLALTSLRGTGRAGSGRLILDALLFAVSVGAICWELVMAPDYEPSAGFMANCTNVGYSAGDMLLLVGIATVLLNNGRAQRPRGLVWLCGAFGVWLVADTAFMVLSAGGGYQTGSWPDPLWPLGYLLAGVGALVFIREGAREKGVVETGQPASRWKNAAELVRVALPYVAVPSIAALLCFRFIIHEGTQTGDTVTVGVALSLTAMVLVRQYVVVIENRRLQASLGTMAQELELRVVERTEELAAEKEHLTRLNQVAEEMSQCVTTRDVIRGGLRLVRETAGCACSSMWLTRAEKRPQFFGDRGLSSGTRLQILAVLENSGMATKVIAGGGVARLDGEELRACGACGDNQEAFQSVVILPLTSRGSILGLLCLGFQDPPSEGEIALAHAATSQVAVALENSRRYADARRMAEEDSVTGLLNSRGLARYFDKELARSQRAGTPLAVVAMDLDNFRLFNDMYGHAMGDRVLRQAADAIKKVLRRSDIVGRQGGDEFIAILSDTSAASALECFSHVRDALRAVGFSADGEHAVPLTMSCGISEFPHDGSRMGELLGVADANVCRSRQRGGDCVTPSSVEDRDEELPEGTFTVLEGLVVAVDNKDHYTWQHSDDVTRYALELAGRIGLSSESMRPLRIAGLLHDVGKIGIPDCILRKPGPLCREEFEAIKQHVSLGEVMIKEIPDLSDVLAAVGSHHERWDGDGYPRGLVGEGIPLLGRILAVSDAYSAMTTDRPYRKALVPAEARKEMQRIAGAQLDPYLVEVFMEILDERESDVSVAGSLSPSVV